MELKFSQSIIKAVKVLGVAGMFAILAMMLMMTVDVILRYIFNMPLLWSYNTSEYLMVGFTYLGIAYTELREEHVGVMLIFSRFSKKTQAILNIINRSMMLGLSIVITVQAWERTIDSLRVGRTAIGPVKIPQAPADASILIGCLALCLLLMVKIYGYGRQLYDLKSDVGPNGE